MGGSTIGFGWVHIERNIPPADVFDLIDRQALFRQRWGYRRINQSERLRLETRLLAMWQEIADRKNWSAAAAWAVFRARRAGRELMVEGVRPAVCLDLLLEKMPGPGKRSFEKAETMALQAVTLGKRIALLARGRISMEARLYWHGLAAEATEALAEWCSLRIADHLGWDEYLRLSPGFPCWPELAEQRKIFSFLGYPRIGLRLRNNLQLEPEYSTTALILRQKRRNSKMGIAG